MDDNKRGRVLNSLSKSEKATREERMADIAANRNGRRITVGCCIETADRFKKLGHCRKNEGTLDANINPY